MKWLLEVLCFLFELFIDLLEPLDSVHCQVGVVDDGVGVQGSALEQIGDEGGSHDLGDELDQEGEADQGKHDGQSSVEKSLAREPDVRVSTETQTAAVARSSKARVSR